MELGRFSAAFHLGAAAFRLGQETEQIPGAERRWGRSHRDAAPLSHAAATGSWKDGAVA